MLQGPAPVVCGLGRRRRRTGEHARGFGRLVDYVETVSGADRQAIAKFFATGMLMYVLAAMQYSLGGDPRHSWVARLAEGCKDDE